ncbi:hypothetical protein A2U01_0074455, partial [Trifolium medium]|nr:hypothetical protein [Trifolium medium]
MDIPHEAFNHADSVRAFSLGIKSLVHYNGGNVPELTRQH